MRAALLAGKGAADTYELAFHAAAAMEVLSELCGTPLFYYRHGRIRTCMSCLDLVCCDAGR